MRRIVAARCDGRSPTRVMKLAPVRVPGDCLCHVQAALYPVRRTPRLLGLRALSSRRVLKSFHAPGRESRGGAGHYQQAHGPRLSIRPAHGRVYPRAFAQDCSASRRIWSTAAVGISFGPLPLGGPPRGQRTDAMPDRVRPHTTPSPLPPAASCPLKGNTRGPRASTRTQRDRTAMAPPAAAWSLVLLAADAVA